MCHCNLKVTKDYYALLGLSEQATEADIKTANRQEALKYHPDRNKEKGAEEQFKEMSRAYFTLCDSFNKSNMRHSKNNKFG